MHILSSARAAPRTHAVLLALALLLASPLALAAQVGKVVFTAGTVTLEAGGRSLKAGDPLSVGDTVVTAPGARAQLLMGDGAKVALRAGSRFRIDEFQLAAAIRDPGAATVAVSTGRSVSTLLKGGFRTVSGSIGKGDPGAYEVRVPVGTLGIRGTDYVAVFCRGDCSDGPGLKPGEPVRDGLYLGVYTGRIVFRGGGLEIVVAAGEFVFIPVPSLKPEPLQEPPAPARGDGAGPLDFTGRGAAGVQGRATIKDTSVSELNGRRGPPPPPAETTVPPAAAPALPIGAEVNGQPVDLTPGQAPRTLGSAYVTGPLGGVISPGAVSASTALYAFGGANGAATTLPVVTDAGAAQLGIGTAVASDTGYDATTGVRWGRWSGGSVDLINRAGAVTPLPLGTESVHWVAGAAYLDAQPPAMPISGSRIYDLVGGTPPTDALGNVGKLGSLTLTADFARSALAADISLTIANTTWTAKGAGAIGALAQLPAEQFSGSFAPPTIGGVAQAAGGGQFNGFFSNLPGQTTGAPGAAGVSYLLTAPAAGAVSGAAALVGR